MGLSGVPASERIHIGFFGRRNAGKSSLINAVTGQNLSIVSDVLGTTTDPVSKTMELLPIGPVVITDTPGIDDVGELGKQRVNKAYEVLNKCDIAVVVIDSSTGKTNENIKLLKLISEKKLMCIVCYNKCDETTINLSNENEICVSAKTGKNIFELKEKIASFAKNKTTKYIIADKLNKADIVILVMPIDSAAPKGRIILPQQQILREVLDIGGIAVCVQPDELEATLNTLSKKPKVVVCDSQVFAAVDKKVPPDIPLTSFSILMINYKGELKSSLESVSVISTLKDGDVVLVSEGCTHHRQCEDIGTVKIPALIKTTSRADVKFEFTSGGDFPSDLTKYSLIVQCGGCMLTEKEVMHRINCAAEQSVPMTNYGVALAYMNGILDRCVEFLL